MFVWGPNYIIAFFVKLFNVESPIKAPLYCSLDEKKKYFCFSLSFFLIDCYFNLKYEYDLLSQGD